jgi:hypothetical protein
MQRDIRTSTRRLGRLKGIQYAVIRRAGVFSSFFNSVLRAGSYRIGIDKRNIPGELIDLDANPRYKHVEPGKNISHVTRVNSSSNSSRATMINPEQESPLGRTLEEML